MPAADLSSVLLLSSLIACAVVSGEGGGGAAQSLIDGTQSSNVYHLDLLQRPDDASKAAPWFDGFGGGVAVATVGHPLRRMLLHLRKDGIGLEEGMSWAKTGKAADAGNYYRHGYQQVDNYLVRVLAGKSAWELPPGHVGKAELKAARTALGKFEVVLRADCLAVDLPLLQPYLVRPVSADGFEEAARGTEELLEAGDPHYLVVGEDAQRLLRENRWDLQLWDFALKLVESRSTTKEGYMCGSSNAARRQRMPGEGKRAVVYNSPSFHITGVAMFSCVLMSLGFEVTAVIKDPGVGFRHLLPCPDTVVTLDGHYRSDVPGEILDEDTAADLGLSAAMTPDQESQRQQQQRSYEEYQIQKRREEEEEEEAERRRQEQERQQREEGGQAGGGGGDGRRRTEELRRRGRRKLRNSRALSVTPGGGGVRGGRRTEAERRGPFDLSVLCTVVSDVNHLMKARYPVDPRLADALLWDVDISIWNLHSVEGAFRSEHRVPPAVEDFARGVPSMAERGGGGRIPPSTFLTLYGEHVEQWHRWSEEVYEGWGWDKSHPPHSRGIDASAAAAAGVELSGGGPGWGDGERGNSTFGAIFRRPGVVYPIHPTGHLRLPRPKRPFGGAAAVEGDQEGGEQQKQKEEVIYVVQGNMQSFRRDYPELTRCLEEMCSTGRGNYQLIAVGSRGDLPEEIRSRECVEKRTTEWRHLEYPEFYGNISAGHFVVTAAAGHDYEFDKATSTVPTALLLERPLVMSSMLLDAYPCLRRSRVHSMVANDNLCLNLQAAYDLTTDEYDEMELEARDCKLEMWRHARETVAGMASGWTLD